MKKIFSLVLVLTVLILTGCSRNTIDDKTIVVGASPIPHSKILEQAKEYIKSKGYTLEIVEYDDYILPNKGVDSGELDANFFQHKPYLENFNKENKTNIVSVLELHYEPLGIYKAKKSNLTEATSVAIPNDGTNRGRALLLLASQGLITINEDKLNDVNVTKSDIINDDTNQIKKENIIEVEANIVISKKSDVDVIVANGNYALNADIIKDKLAQETTIAEKYVNIVAVNKGNEEKDAIKVLIEALKQDNIKEFIESEYKGSVVYYAK